MPQKIKAMSQQYLKDKLRYGVNFYYVVKHIKVHVFDIVHSYGCSQGHLGMPKVIPNIKCAICQDIIEL